MNNYMEYGDKIAFHPGYYIKETIDASGLTQEDFAKRLGTTPKNLSILIRGEQRLSAEMAGKLSRMLGTSVDYWLNLQNAYDALIVEFDLAKELERERYLFQYLDYKYFRDNFALPDLPRKKDEQIQELRSFLNVSTLSVFNNKDLAVSFRNSAGDFSEKNTVRANVMVQIAVNKVLHADAPKYDKRKFEDAVQYALTLTKCHDRFYPLLKEAFEEAGVIFVILPNLPGSKTTGASKKVENHVMLMVNDRYCWSDVFWFTLFHEIAHVLNNDFGVSFESGAGEKKKEKETEANRYAEDCLIPPEAYQEFLNQKRFDLSAILAFADQIERDPGIVLGRLQNDGLVKFNDSTMTSLRKRYKVVNE